jgi:hypothetical protein
MDIIDNLQATFLLSLCLSLYLSLSLSLSLSPFSCPTIQGCFMAVHYLLQPDLPSILCLPSLSPSLPPKRKQKT